MKTRNLPALILVVILASLFLLPLEREEMSEGGADEAPAESKVSAEAVVAAVTNVIDGDTIEVAYEGGTRERVRFIGVDTPEIDWEEMSAECYGFEAKEFLTEIVKGREVVIRGDSTQPTHDSYGRRLAYVFLESEGGVSEFVNISLLEEGYARELLVGERYEYREDFLKAQSSARDSELGRWSACVS